MSAERAFRISKALTRLLRHRAEEGGLHLRSDGFFSLADLLRTREKRACHARPEELLHIVRTDSKQRYTLRYFRGDPFLRAAQGHSQYVNKDQLMTRMRLYHGTRARYYRSIVRQGLMAGGPTGSRTDVHLVEHLPSSGQRVVSGWRPDCEIAVQVAPQAAESGGCVFYRSDNGVYLTEGVRGSIPPRYISAVVILRTGEVITSPTKGTAPSGEAVDAGLRRARRVYMRVEHELVAVASLDGWALNLCCLVPCEHDTSACGMCCSYRLCANLISMHSGTC